jgi:hypothetical protein
MRMRILLGTLVLLIAFSDLAQAQFRNGPFSSPGDNIARETRLLRESQERAARESRESSRNIAIGIVVAGIAIAGAMIYKKKSS